MTMHRPNAWKNQCARRWLAAAALLAASLPASALFKVVGPDGRVTYTDRPPSDTAARVTTLGREDINAVPAPSALPLALRQTAERYPVTLYSTAECAACDAARQYLVRRGVPFAEKLIVNDDDTLALEQLLGTRSVPALSIGAQALRGFSTNEWSAYLDAAGYPRESVLPSAWQASAPTPLAARAPVRAPAAIASVPAAARPAATPVQSAPGLRF